MYRHSRSCLKEPVLRAPHCPRFREPARNVPEAGIRHELVERVRREIAEGVYDTPEKWEAALARLQRRLEE